MSHNHQFVDPNSSGSRFTGLRSPSMSKQGDSLEDLDTHLRDLYQYLTSGELPGIRRVGDIAVA